MDPHREPDPPPPGAGDPPHAAAGLHSLVHRLLEQPPDGTGALPLFAEAPTVVTGPTSNSDPDLFKLFLSADTPSLVAADPSSSDSPPVASPFAEHPGQVIGNFTLIQPIGDGGFGTVWRARQTKPVGREVALKIIKLGMDTNDVVARFEQERQAVALMDHPHVAKVFDAGTTPSGRPYIAMEWVNGEAITTFCDKQRLKIPARLRLFIDVCRAVQHAHQKGVIHRDLKPSNILVTEVDGKPMPKLIDFGVAKALDVPLTEDTMHTIHGQIIGTPEYMSPEQAEGDPRGIDTRTDIFALGVLLYELLTGTTPLDSRVLRSAGVEAMCRLIRETEPELPSKRVSALGGKDSTAAATRQSTSHTLQREISGDLDWITLKALAREKQQRYESTGHLIADVRACLVHEPVTAGPPGAVYRLRKLVRRHRAPLMVATAFVAILMGATAVSLRLARIAGQNAEKANAANAEIRRTLHLTSVADYKSARRAWVSGFRTDPGDLPADSRSSGTDWPLSKASVFRDRPSGLLSSRTKWQEVLALVARSLQREPSNERAAIWLHDLIRHHVHTMRGWPEHLLPHEGGVTGAVFNGDGAKVATASSDNTARVWSVATGRSMGPPLQHEGRVSAVSFSPDGTKVATASWDKTARIWSLDAKGTICTLRGHTDALSAVCFSPDGRMALTASVDRTARLWDVATGQPVGEPFRHGGAVLAATFSPDGTKLVTASAAKTDPDETNPDKAAIIWNVAGHAMHGIPLPHGDAVSAVRFSPDGKKLVTASWDYTARIWDVATCQPVGDPLQHEDAVSMADFSPDGTRVITASADRTARLWDASDGHRLGASLEHQDTVVTASFSADGTRVVTGSWDHTAHVWDASSSRVIGEPLRHDKAVSAAAFSPDGTRVLTSSEDATARLWEPGSMASSGACLRHEDAVSAAAFSSDGLMVLTASWDKTVRLWRAATARATGPPLLHDDIVLDAAFSPDAARVVTAGRDGSARIWDVRSGSMLGLPLRHNDAAFAKDAPSDGTMSALTSVEFSPDGRWLVTASWDRTARIWNVDTRKALGQPLRHEGVVHFATFSPDGTRVATASADKTARIWRVADGVALSQPLLHDNTVRHARFNRDGTKLVTASWDKTVRIWDALSGVALGKPLLHNNAVNDASFSPDGKEVVTASDDGTSRLWDLESGELLGEPLRHGDAVIASTFSPDGTTILTASADKTARLWRHRVSLESPDLAPRTMEAVVAWTQGLAGLLYDDNGELTPVPTEARLTSLMDPGFSERPWAMLAAWVTTPAPARMLEPGSRVSLREMAELERDFNGGRNIESLESALRYDPTVPLARLMLAGALEREDAARSPDEREANLSSRTAFLRAYDLKRLPDDAALWAHAARLLIDQKQASLALDAARKAVDLDPKLPAAIEALQSAGALSD